MISIRVRGRGLIPRTNSIAPKMSPFKADQNLIQLILNTNGLEPEYFNPADGKYYPITKANYRKVFNDLKNVKAPVVEKSEVKQPEVVKEVPKEDEVVESTSVVQVLDDAKPVETTLTTSDEPSTLSVILDTNSTETSTENTEVKQDNYNSYKKEKYKKY